MLLIFAAQALIAQQARDARSPLFVSTSWLADHLRDPDLVLLHVGEKLEYDAGHIPGERYVSLQDISVSDRTNPDGLVLEVPSATDLHDRLAALGIGDKSRIVVYFGRDWVSPTTRVLFTLDYAGLGAQSAMLEGGMPRWKSENRELVTEVPAVKKGSLSPLKVRWLVVDADWVSKHLRAPSVSIVDARDTEAATGR
jgi:thiosulfate/3-mercaptopyruvate sulfurtransferase